MAQPNRRILLAEVALLLLVLVVGVLLVIRLNRPDEAFDGPPSIGTPASQIAPPGGSTADGPP